MKLLWTKSKMPLSLLIRAVTGESVSHFAIAFDDRVVFHSNLYGCHIQWLPTFLKSSTVVLEETIPLSLQQEEEIYQCLIAPNDGKGYDFLAAIYLGYRILLQRWFKTPLPKRNRWGDGSREFCCELYARLPVWLRGGPKDLDCSMETPYSLYQLYKRSTST